MSSDTNFKDIEEQTQKVYESYAEEYDEKRNRDLFEKSYLDKVISHLTEGASVLDLGCGAGEPIARYLIEKGVNVTGLDYSHKMLSLCKERFPDHQWIFGDMRNLEVEDFFEAIISWGAFFHLTIDQQRDSLPKVCNLLKSNGVLLITVGHDEGEVTGTVAGQKVYHASLSKEEYERILEKCNLEVLEFNFQDPKCHGFSVLLGKKK